MKAESSEWSRRDFLRLGATVGAGASLAGSPVSAQSASYRDDRGPDDFNEATIAQLQAAMANHRISAVELTRFYLRRIQAIDETGPAPQLGDRAQSRRDRDGGDGRRDTAGADACSDRCMASRCC